MTGSARPHRFRLFLGSSILLPAAACTIAHARVTAGQPAEALHTLRDSSDLLARRMTTAGGADLQGSVLNPLNTASPLLTPADTLRPVRVGGESADPSQGRGSRILGTAILVALIAVVLLWGAIAIMAKTEKT